MTLTHDNTIICDILKQEISPEAVALYDEEQNIHISIGACKFGITNYEEGWRYPQDNESA